MEIHSSQKKEELADGLAQNAKKKVGKKASRKKSVIMKCLFIPASQISSELVVVESDFLHLK